MLVAGPLLGYFAGNWLDEKFGTEPYLMIILILIGLVSSGRETYILLKQLSDGGEDSND